MAAEVYSSLKPLEFKGIIEILQCTCLRHNRAGVSRGRGAASALSPPVTGALPGSAGPQLSWRGETLLQFLRECVLPCILSLCPELHLETVLIHRESVWCTRDLWMNVLRAFAALLLVTVFKHFYIVGGPFIPNLSILLNSVLAACMCF